MVDNWRVKKYYDKRVLVETARILDSSFEATLICLEGAELELLRNMCQYLHRRSTFASEYHVNYYVAPSTIEWNELDAIVANLEEKLMGCTEITALLEAILTQVTCVCQKTGGLLENDLTVPDYGPSLPIVIDDYIGGGGLQAEDDYAGDTVIDVNRCPIAQLVFWQAWEFTTEIMQPVVSETIDILLPGAMVALATMCGTTVLLIPVGVLLALLWKLIEIDVAGSMVDVTNAMWANKQELICAVWNGLAVDYQTAQQNAKEVIANMDGLSALDKAALMLMYSPWAIGLAEKAWTNSTAWALANVSAGACDTCVWWARETWTLPPCPGDWTGTFSCTPEGRIGIKSDTVAYSNTFVLPDILANVDFDLEYHWTSVHPYGWTVGTIWVQYQDSGMVWQNVGAMTCINNAPPASMNTGRGELLDKTIPRNVLRLKLDGYAGQGQSDPWPFELGYVQVTAVST